MPKQRPGRETDEEVHLHDGQAESDNIEEGVDEDMVLLLAEAQ